MEAFVPWQDALWEILSLWVKEASDGVSVRACTKRTNVQLVQLRYVLQKRLSVWTKLGVIPGRLRPQLEMVRVLTAHAITQNKHSTHFNIHHILNALADGVHIMNVNIQVTATNSISTATFQANLGPDVQNILWQSYDCFTIMPKLRLTYYGRLIYKISYKGHKAFLRYSSHTKSQERLRQCS